MGTASHRRTGSDIGCVACPLLLAWSVSSGSVAVGRKLLGPEFLKVLDATMTTPARAGGDLVQVLSVPAVFPAARLGDCLHQLRVSRILISGRLVVPFTRSLVFGGVMRFLAGWSFA